MDRVPFSGGNLDINEIAHHHKDVVDALSLFFSSSSPTFLTRFAGWTVQEVDTELESRKAELDLTSTMNLLASIEATFRIDYLQRCYQRKKGDLSYKMRNLHKKRDQEHPWKMTYLRRGRFIDRIARLSLAIFVVRSNFGIGWHMVAIGRQSLVENTISHQYTNYH